MPEKTSRVLRTPPSATNSHCHPPMPKQADLPHAEQTGAYDGHDPVHCGIGRPREYEKTHGYEDGPITTGIGQRDGRNDVSTEPVRTLPRLAAV